MKMCWNLEPTERPTFSKISQMIKQLLGDQLEQEQVSLYETPMFPELWDKTYEAPKQNILIKPFRPIVLSH